VWFATHTTTSPPGSSPFASIAIPSHTDEHGRIDGCPQGTGRARGRSESGEVGPAELIKVNEELAPERERERERGEAEPTEVNEVRAAMAPMGESMKELAEVGERRGDAAEEVEEGPARGARPGGWRRGWAKRISMGKEEMAMALRSLSLPQFVASWGVSMGGAEIRIVWMRGDPRAS
jgi:hypothetical protein